MSIERHVKLSVENLRIMARSAIRRTEKKKKDHSYDINYIKKIQFNDFLIPNVQFRETLSCNIKTGTLSFYNMFEPKHNKKLYFVDIP